MKSRKFFLIIALVSLLSLFFSGSFVVAQITGKITGIYTPIPGDVTGNKGNDDTTTDLTDNLYVPQRNNNVSVYSNHVVIYGDTGVVNGDSYGGITYGDGTVSENTVTINTGGTASFNVYGGYSEGDGSVNNNTINISGVASGDVYGGFAYGAGGASGNTVTITASGEAAALITAGRTSGNGAVSYNRVEIHGRVSGITYSAYSMGTGSVENNIITVGSTGVASNVIGGRSDNLDSTSSVSGNTVTIHGHTALAIGAMSNGSSLVYNNTVIVTGSATQVGGGRSDGTGSVNNNTVIIGTNGTASQNVYGGRANNNTNSYGTVSSNTVIIENGGTAPIVYGGNSLGYGDVNNNTVTIEYGGTATTVAIGGRVFHLDSIGTVSGNTVTINGHTMHALGGMSNGNGLVYNNTVIVGANGTVSQEVYGGHIDNVNSTGMVTGNTVIIENGGTAPIVYGGNSNGSGDVTSNTVIIRGKVTDDTYGGYSTSSGNVDGNAVTVSGIVSGEVYGGSIDISTTTGAVTANNVTIESSGTVNSAVYGGRSAGSSKVGSNTVIIRGKVTGDVYGGYSSFNGNVVGNTVTISGAVIGAIYGGFTTGSGNIIGNTINITSTAILANASLYGSNISGVSGTGNTLNVDRFQGSLVTMGNFENYNFVLGQLDSTLTFINITGNEVNINGSVITISFASEFLNNTLSLGDVITVISDINANATPESITVASSPFVVYDFIETHTAGALLLTVDSMGLQPQTEAVGEGFVAGLAFLGQAADLRSNLEIVPTGQWLTPFAAMSYGSQYITTGSSVNVKGFSALMGLVLNKDLRNGDHLTVGFFFEGGRGNYNSRNSFNNSTLVRGQGSTEYYGGGVLARYALKNGLYSEGAFATGKTKTDFRSRDFAPDTTSKYDFSVPYYSAHLTVGQVLRLTHMLDLDVYGKYLWTRQNGDTVDVNDYRFIFKAADSHRLRVGGRLQADVSPQLQPYVGAAYEYEFSGRINGSLSGMNLDKPSLRGGTGIGELGLVWTPNGRDDFKVDLGVQGYAGKREGVSGGLTVSLSF